MHKAKWRAVVLSLGMVGVYALATASCGSPRPIMLSPLTEAGDKGSDGSADATEDGSDDATLPGDDGGGFVLFDAVAPEAAGPCVPVTACPSGVQCGRYVDPCSGAVFVCGTACPSGQVCTTTSTTPPAQSCAPKACAGKCGVVGVDTCGVAIGCGGCPSGQDCVSNQCVPQGSVATDAATSDGCPALTCTSGSASAGVSLCGTIHDTCGNSMACTCPSGQMCSNGVCTVLAPECDLDGGAPRCGSVQNACGSGTVACGGCSGANKCASGTCTACTPPACGGAVCGSTNNGCGPAVSCGTCPASEVCEDGGCCTPMTCPAALDAGLVSGCAPVDLGCGIKKSCDPCPTAEICVNNSCQLCVPKACSDFGNAGCGHSDGCGHTLNCCGAGTACQGTICCAPGEVNYNGSCCLPGCDLDQPSGPQVSCGQVIICTGGSGSSSGGGSSSSGTAR